ncbi:hypothetical protein RO3G_03485 [Rhizopus delemar RA 99-880]|uniref:Uncharacterized protein n=1 Tax=Rhizopus delemar (strain RA 99-880 / ATCC MYA-4621 / FGSC 9543 / NRRL 43880) TaxID=246409 RepID=I1BRF0_RHIO9|nr:hypothetical protein RO3G_03485 [Rhizopus delemar RA 99-880]|eukprot:EIE78780.1 hypothetical protein RO3G_03485 [Rhizopus delemar RA 99-880]
MKIASIVLLALGSYLLNSNVAEAGDVCLTICSDEAFDCPDGWTLTEQDACWSCCCCI